MSRVSPYSKIFNAVQALDPQLVKSGAQAGEEAVNRCRIYCVNPLNSSSAYFFMSLHYALENSGGGLDFQLHNVGQDPQRQYQTNIMFEGSFRHSGDMASFHQACASGRLNPIAFSHRIYRLEFPDQDLATINYNNPYLVHYDEPAPGGV